MDKRTAVTENLKKDGLLPLFFHPDITVSIRVLRSLYDAGSRVLEYTNRGANALPNFRELRKICDNELPEMLLGAGTVKDSVAAENFIEAGADFIISPGISEDIYDSTYSNKILWIPGCMTPSEIIKAEQFGLSFVKLFPGNILGPGFLSAIREVFPLMHFLPTGGVLPEADNLKAWFTAGASAVGMGSKLLSPQLVNQGLYDELSKKTRHALETIKSLKP